jgi:hypothetical protein
MAEPVNFQFWEPKQTMSQDLSAGVQMGATLAATYVAAGRALGENLREGLIALGENQKKAAEEGEIQQLFDNLADEGTWTANEWVPAEMAFPGVIAKHMGEDGKLDRAGAIQDIAARLVSSQGIPEDEAIRKAQWGVETQEYRIMKPDKRGQWMRQYGGLVARGIPAQQLEGYANMLTKDSYFTPGEAQQDLQVQADKMFQPSEPGWREQQAVMQGDREDMTLLESELAMARDRYGADRSAENAQNLARLQSRLDFKQRKLMLEIDQQMQREELAFRAGEGEADRKAAMERVQAQVEGNLAEAQIRSQVGGEQLDKADVEALQDFTQAAAQFGESGSLPRTWVSMDPKDFPIMADEGTMSRILGNLGIQAGELSNFALSFDQNGKVVVAKVTPNGDLLPGSDAASAKLQSAIDADPTVGATLTAKLLMAGRDVTREKLERIARVVSGMNPLALQLVQMQIARSQQGKPRNQTRQPTAASLGETPSWTQRVIDR